MSVGAAVLLTCLSCSDMLTDIERSLSSASFDVPDLLFWGAAKVDSTSNEKKPRSSQNLDITILPSVITAGSELIKSGMELVKQHRDLKFQRERFAIDLTDRWKVFEATRAFQRELVQIEYQQQLQLVGYERQTALGVEEFKRILDNFPWRTSPSVLLNTYRDYGRAGRPLPLLVIIAPPSIDSDTSPSLVNTLPMIERSLAEEIRQFLHKYSRRRRAVKFLSGVWDSKRLHSEAAIENLFSLLKPIPVLIIESEADQRFLNMRAYFWGLQGEDLSPASKPILSKFPYRDILNEFAKEDALRWRAEKDKFTQAGRQDDYLREVGGNDDLNLATLENEIADGKAGIVRPRDYRINSEHVERLSQFLALCHCIIAGMTTDIYNLCNFQNPPLLPALLRELPWGAMDSSLGPQVVQTIVSSYQEAYSMLEGHLSHWLPDLYIQLGLGLAHLPEKSWALDQIHRSIEAWLSARGEPKRIGLLEVVGAAIRERDYEFAKNLRKAFAAVGDQKSVGLIRGILEMEEPSLEMV